MAKGVLIALTNPVSAEREDDFNIWYDTVHAAEVMQLEGIAALTRYKAKAQVIPPAEPPLFRYLTVYQLDDVDQALQSLADAQGGFQTSDAVDFATTISIGFEEIFSTRN